jgi:hypothetical protein
LVPKQDKATKEAHGSKAFTQTTLQLLNNTKLYAISPK